MGFFCKQHQATAAKLAQMTLAVLKVGLAQNLVPWP